MQHLQTRPQFQAVLAGRTLARTPHFSLHVCPLDATGAALFPLTTVWLGALLPKRWAKRAVTRNAIRRQIYGVASAHADTLPAAAHLVRLRATFDRTQFVSASSAVLKHAVRTELQQLFRLAQAAGAP